MMKSERVQGSGFRVQAGRRRSLASVFFLKPENRNLKPLALWLVVAWLGACLDLHAAASVRSHMVWVGEEPKLQVTLDPGLAAGKDATQTVWIAVRPVNNRGESPEGFVTGHALKLTGDGKPVTATLPLLGGGTPKDRLWSTSFRSGKEDVSAKCRVTW
jgi:hypothetical protein